MGPVFSLYLTELELAVLQANIALEVGSAVLKLRFSRKQMLLLEEMQMSGLQAPERWAAWGVHSPVRKLQEMWPLCS